ncbi:MAG: efflux RND transporter periplasmic adaptor subunit [Gammaproteobacteria bacterium]|nr:efflux RND transporter periplasmic adaptor subunit [Gammaproteobacteria bacterium]
MLWLKITLPIVLIAVAALAAVALFAARTPAVQNPAPPPTLLVDVAEARREPVTFVVRSQGVVAPRTRTTIVSEVSGTVVEVSPAFVAGGFFEKGDVLVRIDPRNYSTALKRATAAVAQAETKVATENALAGYAYEDWERLRSLEAADRPASDLTLRKPQLAEAVAGLESAEADLEKATEDLSRTVIRAPYDGMVREKRADVGQFVNTGTPVAETFATDYAEIRLPIPQTDLQYLELARLNADGSLQATLRADIGGVIHDWSAEIVRTEGVFDPDTRVLHLVAQVQDPYASGGEPLRIGTFVSAAIEGMDAGDVFVIPRHSLERGRTLWMVGSETRRLAEEPILTIRPRDLEVVRTDEGFAYVAAGLRDGERYTVTPPENSLPGMRVRINSE